MSKAQDILGQSLVNLSRSLRDGQVSSVELTEFYLQRIATHNEALNAFITITADKALAQAKQCDALIAKGEANALTGIPYAHKDLFCTKDVLTTCASKMLGNFIAPYDATVSQKLNAAGMVLLGKTNMDEFAMGSSNEGSFYGPVANPWRSKAVPGGSSGGSAAAVAAGLAPCATATDTGGSIRQPAAFCGVTGIKPTYGRVSRFGMIAYASSLDQGGVIARTAEDCALLLQQMAGFDERDSTSVDQPVPDYVAQLKAVSQSLRIGVPRQFFSDDLDPAIAQCIEQACEVLKDAGYQLVDVDLSSLELAIGAYYIIASAECSSNLSRYDGVRYGHRCADPKNLEDLYTRSRAEGFGQEVKRRIMMGNYVLSSGYYDAYYRRAQKVRRLVRDDFLKAFEQVDVLLSPVTPTTAFDQGAKQNPVEMYQSDIYTVPANLAGLPALSAPAGLIDGLPVGLQLIAPHFEEHKLFEVAHRYQQSTDWHTQWPASYAPEEGA